MIINPLNIPSDDEFLVKNEPTDEAIAPREINTMEKPRQNSREPPQGRKKKYFNYMSRLFFRLC